MNVLFETSEGFALFKVLDERNRFNIRIKNPSLFIFNLAELTEGFLSPESAKRMVKLKAFKKFENTSEAVEAVGKLLEGSPSEGLLKFLKDNCEGESLAVADSNLGKIIKEKLNIDCVHNIAVLELLRGIRSQYTELISDLEDQDLAPMSLDLSHSLARSKLNLGSDEEDTLIIEAVRSLNDLDKELNKCAKKVRDRYGRHFPELSKIIEDNILYVESVKVMGNRVNAKNLDFSEILEYEVEAELKEAAAISKGKELSEVDLIQILELCDEVLSIDEQRFPLYDQLKSVMSAFAPNLTAVVGEIVGARMISETGSLWDLAKLPGSTIQLLGAEKSLFRAFRTKHATPKYGLICNAPLVVQAPPEHKGKIARSLAAKAAIAIRCDVYGDGQDNTMGLESFAKVEARLRSLEEVKGYDVKMGSVGGGGGGGGVMSLSRFMIIIVLLVCIPLVLNLCWSKFFSI